VEVSKVEEHATGKILLHGCLGFNMNQEANRVTRLVNFGEEIDAFSFPQGDIGKEFLGFEVESGAIEGRSNVRQEQIKEFQEEGREEGLEELIVVNIIDAIHYRMGDRRLMRSWMDKPIKPQLSSNVLYAFCWIVPGAFRRAIALY
jgi:hypothetical protein